MHGFFANGGHACYVVRINDILTSALETNDFVGSSDDRTGLGGLTAIKDLSVVCVPDVMALYAQHQYFSLDAVLAVQGELITDCELMGDRMAILDGPPDQTPQQIKEWCREIADYDSKHAALYYPWIGVLNPTRNSIIHVSPCAVNAGYEGLRVRDGRSGLRGSSGGWRAADTGGVQEAFDAAETHAVDSGEGGGGGTFAVGGDQLGDLAFVEAFTQAPRTLRARSRGAHGVGERHGVAKPQLSGLHGVRVSGKYLHRRTLGSLTWVFMFLRCASPFSRRCGRVTIRVPARRGGRPAISMHGRSSGSLLDGCLDLLDGCLDPRRFCRWPVATGSALGWRRLGRRR